LIAQEASWRVFFADNSVKPLELHYEDFSAEPVSAAHKVLEYLKVDASRAQLPSHPRLQRQADRLTEDVVHRYWVSRRSGIIGTYKSGTGTSARSRMGMMRTDIVVADGFYSAPDQIRAYALRQEYVDAYAASHGGYRPFLLSSRFKRAGDCPFKSSPALIAALEELTGEEIDIDYWRADFPVDWRGAPASEHRFFLQRGSLWNCSFHYKPYSGEEPGTGIHNHVVDTWNQVGPDGWSGVIYLNPELSTPSEKGLSIWRNREASRNTEWMTSRERWELVDRLGNVSNRLILYRGDLPHSGSPGWGEDPRSARICQTFFFRTVSPARRSRVAVEL
jgi:hypothetical protein